MKIYIRHETMDVDGVDVEVITGITTNKQIFDKWYAELEAIWDAYDNYRDNGGPQVPEPTDADIYIQELDSNESLEMVSDHNEEYSYLTKSLEKKTWTEDKLGNKSSDEENTDICE